MPELDPLFPLDPNRIENTTMTTTTNVEEIYLVGYDREFMPSVRPLLFGHMLTRAMPIIEHYPSDLFHDAQWITRHVNGEVSFYWGPRSWGSFIGLDPSVILSGGKPEGLAFYRIDVYRDGGKWMARFTRCEPEDCELLVLPRQPVLARDVMRLVNSGFPVTLMHEGSEYRATSAHPNPYDQNHVRFLDGSFATLSVHRDTLVEIDAEIEIPAEKQR